MIPLTSLLLLTPGVRVRVLGEGQLRFAAGRTALLAASATLAPNAAGLLADAAGRPLLPQIKVGPGALRIVANGTVSVAGHEAGRIYLVRASDVGLPGEGTFGVLDIAAPLPSGGGAGKIASTLETKPHISLRAGITELAEGRVLLRDVADIVAEPSLAARLGAIDLGTVPTIGVRRGLTIWTLRSALRGAGFPDPGIDLSMPIEAMVAQRSQAVSDDAILAEATRAAQAAFGTGDVRYQPTSVPTTLRVAAGTLVLRTTAGQPSGERLIVDVAVLVDGKDAGRRSLTFLAHRDGVRSGDAVRVTLSRNGAVLVTDAKARTTGYVGETVQIATAEGATLTATVTGTGAVEVKL